MSRVAGGADPAEIEAAFAADPYIREAAVLELDGARVAIVVPDLEAARGAGTGRLGDLLRATVGAVALRAPGDRRIADYAVARGTLPRDGGGALRRDLLPELYARLRAGERDAAAAPPAEADRALLADPLARRLWDWLVARYPGRALSLDTCFSLDLGLDSLDWVELGLEIQDRLGLVLDEDAVARVVTLRDLLREATAAPAAAPLPPDWPARPEAALTARRRRWLVPRGPALTALFAALYAANRWAIRGLFGLTVEGLTKLPAAGPFVIAVNHVSDLDHFVVAAALPWRRLRRGHWGGDARRLFANPVLRLMSRACGVFPANDSFAAPTLASGLTVLARGRFLVWFPEGWRSPDGALQPFARGVGVLLKHGRVPVVPAIVGGTYEAMPRWRRWPRLRPLRVVFGDPLDPDALEAAGHGAEPYARVADGLRRAMQALADRG